MSGKHSKKSHNPSIKRFLLGKSAKVALGPLGSQSELDAKSEDDQNPGPSRIVFCEGESGGQGPPAPETPTKFAVAIDDIEFGNRPQKLRPSVVLTEVSEEAANGFGPLTALLRAIFDCANREESVDVRNKVEVLLPHVTSLDELFATPPGDVDELRRRDKLIIKIEGIKEQLQLSFEPSMQQRLGDPTQDDRGVFGHLEDLQEAIFHYQMVRRTTIDDQGYNSIDPGQSISLRFRIYNTSLLKQSPLVAGAAVLNNFRCAKRVEYRHGDRNSCLKGTRTTILDEIELWTRDFDRPPVYWLNGLAGTGKTTIAQTISERIFADGRLGASFFCSRDFEDRSNLKFIFPTLAVQLARKYSKFRSIFVPLVQSDPEIADESLYGQMNKLIVQPLMKSSISTVIVIDALDECKDEEPASAILSVLGQFVSQITKVKFFVTGRPEPRIREGFRLRLLAEATDLFVLHEVGRNQVYSDIRLFFGHNFAELKGRRRELDGWPTEEQLDLLCERADGLFIHAVATVRFIVQRNCNPKRQLDRLLRSPESSAFEGKTKFKMNNTLDSLYASILQEAFGDDDPEDDPKVRSILSAAILSANPLAPSAIATLLDMDAEDVFPLLLSVHSLFTLREDINHPVRPFHKSFPDFIVDPVRCTNPRFRICPADQHTELLVACLELMNQRLKLNICDLPDGISNSEVEDLRERTEKHIDQALEYSCRSWHKHLVDVVPAQTLKIIPLLHRFLEEKFLFWLEVLSILGVVRVAVDALEATVKLLDGSLTLNIVRDYLRFVITFLEVIDKSVPHIYHSALPLSPRTSVVCELYERYARPLARIVRGLPVSWDPAIATVYHEGFVGAAAWSLDDRLFAVTWPKSVEILDAVTLKRLNSFEYFQHGGYPLQLSFSPDSRLLTGFCDEGLSIWDLQTGRMVGPGPSESFKYLRSGLSSTYSTDGKLLAVAYDEHTDSFHTTEFTISTYDLLSGTRLLSHRVSEGRMVTPIWTHGEYLRFATVKPGSITIWEVGFTFTHTPAEVESFPAPESITSASELLFIPPLSRLLFADGRSLFIRNVQESEPVRLSCNGMTSSGVTFSSDGHFLARVELGRKLEIWKGSHGRYTLHRKLAFATFGLITPFLSKNGESIITITQSTIQLWSTNDSVPHVSDVPDQADDRTDILEFSPDATLVAVARRKEQTIRILDLKFGDPRLVIDVGMEVLCVRMTRSTVVVIGERTFAWNTSEKMVVTWNIPARGCALGSRAGVGHSVQTTMLSRSGPTSGLLRLDDHISISPTLGCIAFVHKNDGCSYALEIYDGSTRYYLTSATDRRTSMPRFSPDGSQVWLVVFPSLMTRGWKMVRGGEPCTMELEPLESTACRFGIFPWQSSCGYEVTRDGWVLNSTKKRLLWLPHRWRLGERFRTWGGRFLGLHSELPEAVILEFLE